FVTGDGTGGGSIFLVEPTNERVIQMDKVTGKIIQQIKVHADSELRLNQLDGIYIDSSGTRQILYLVNGGQIIRAELPALPRPFHEDSIVPTATPLVTP
ncbi:MAG: hypothetical protein HGA19_22475, partial [Oscillochloris sp.]|nr:hypothetical protein [Oscillochloris sp.]